MRRRRILLIDDNVHAAETLALIMGLWGYDVRVAHDGPSGLELAEDFRPQVVVLDIELPSMDGFEVATRLRDEPALDGLVVISLTGHDLGSLSPPRFTGHFNHQLRKPVELKTLERILAAVVASAGRPIANPPA